MHPAPNPASPQPGVGSARIRRRLQPGVTIPCGVELQPSFLVAAGRGQGFRGMLAGLGLERGRPAAA
jgi:hypothetical protein